MLPPPVLPPPVLPPASGDLIVSTSAVMPAPVGPSVGLPLDTPAPMVVTSGFMIALPFPVRIPSNSCWAVGAGTRTSTDSTQTEFGKPLSATPPQASLG